MAELPKNGERHDWVEYRKLVLDKLETLDEIAKNQIQLRLDVRELKSKAALWGAISGVIGAVIISGLATKLMSMW